MARWGKCDFKELEKLNQRLEQLSTVDFDAFCQDMAQEIAQLLWTKVKKRTPVGKKPHIASKDENDKQALGGMGAKKTTKVTGATGKSRSFLTREGAIYQQYWSGYQGGALRDAWTVLPIEKHGDQYTVMIVNNLEYASYVEYGHRQTPGRYVPALGKSLKASWVKGRFMMTISIREVESQSPAMLQQKLYLFLKEVF